MNSNNNDTDKNKETLRATHTPNAQHAPHQRLTSAQPAPPLQTEHDITWCRISHLFD